MGRTLVVAAIPILLATAQSLALTASPMPATGPLPATTRASAALDRLDIHLAHADAAVQPSRLVLTRGVRAALPAAALPVAAALPRLDSQLMDSALEAALINVDRAQAGLPALRQSALLERVAQLRALDMLTRHYFSHVDPATGGLAFLEVFQSLHVAYQSAGENIAWSTEPSAETFNAWFMASPDHRDNLLNPQFHQVGVGQASVNGRTVIAEIFTN